MAQILVRNLDDATKEKLRARAKRHGRSMEEETRAIIQAGILRDDEPGEKLGSWFAAQAALHGVTHEDVVELEANITGLRALPWPTVSFDEK